MAAPDKDDKDQYVRRVAHLLALAAHPDTPDHEREAAFARAGALMFKHEIEAADLSGVTSSTGERQGETIGLYRREVSGRGGHGRERAWALGAVAEGMGCRVCYRGNTAGSGPRWVQIVGPTATLDNLKILLGAVELQMESAAARAAADRGRDLPRSWSPSQRTTARTVARRSFMRGFGAGIRTRLQAARQEYADDLHHNAQSGDQAATGKELLLADRPQQVLAEFQRLFPDLRPVRTPRRFDHDAYEKGKRAGRDADLGTGHLDGSDHQELT